MEIILIGVAVMAAIYGLFYVIARGSDGRRIEEAPAEETLRRSIPPIHGGPSG